MNSHILKAGIAVFFVAYLQVEQVLSSAVSTMIDKSISIAVLVVLAYILFKLLKEAQRYNEKRDKAYEELLQRSTMAVEKGNDREDQFIRDRENKTEAIKDLAESVKQMAKNQENLNQKIYDILKMDKS